MNVDGEGKRLPKNAGLIDATLAFIVAERDEKGQVCGSWMSTRLACKESDIRDLFFLLGPLVILRMAVASTLHNKNRNRRDQDDVNVTAFMQKNSKHQPHYRQHQRNNPHLMTFLTT